MVTEVIYIKPRKAVCKLCDVEYMAEGDVYHYGCERMDRKDISSICDECFTEFSQWVKVNYGELE